MMKKVILLSVIFITQLSFAQKENNNPYVYRYFSLAPDSANNYLYMHDEVDAPNFLLDIHKAVLRNRINVYEDISDVRFGFPTTMPAVEYVLDKNGQAQKIIDRVNYFETETEDKKTVPNNQDVYEFIMRPIVASELKEIRIMETGRWNKRIEAYEFTPTFIGFQRVKKNDLNKDLVWVHLEELNELIDFRNKSWFKSVLAQEFSGFQYKQYGCDAKFSKDECLFQKVRIIERVPENKILFNDENPSYSMLGQICIHIRDGELDMESENTYRASQVDDDEVFVLRKSKKPLVDETGEPFTMINDAGEEVYAYPYDVELYLSVSKLKYIRVTEENNMAKVLHFVFDEEGKEIEYFSVKIKDIMDLGMRMTGQPWYEHIRLNRYKASTIKQSNCEEKTFRD